MADICARKHGGNLESTAANERVSSHKADLRDRILAWFWERGDHGATCEQASIAMSIRYSTMSARISELRAAGKLVPTGLRAPTSGGSSAALVRRVAEQSNLFSHHPDTNKVLQSH